MATSAILSLSLPSPPFKCRLPFSAESLGHTPTNLKYITIKATSATSQSTTVAPPLSVTTKTDTWQWKFDSTPIKIHFEQLDTEEPNTSLSTSSYNVLLVPTISDVSTVEEWRSVAESIVRRADQGGKANYKVTMVDWPGLGYSDRPNLDYNADVMEKFLVDFVNSPDSPISTSGE